MTIKFSELLTSKQIDAMYLMTIRNEVRRQEIGRLIKEIKQIGGEEFEKIYGDII
jgi:hypothetical protein